MTQVECVKHGIGVRNQLMDKSFIQLLIILFNYILSTSNIIPNTLLEAVISSKGLIYTVNSTVSGHRQFRVTFAKTFLFFQNVKVYRFINYPVIFPNLLAA